MGKSESNGPIIISNVGDINAKFALSGTSNKLVCIDAGALNWNQVFIIDSNALIQKNRPAASNKIKAPRKKTNAFICRGIFLTSFAGAPNNPIPNTLTKVANAIAAVVATQIPPKIIVSLSVEPVK